jgi:membrane protein DedA with SNARE-associated domain
LDVWTWMIELVNVYGYLGAFVVCALGNLSIIIPIPFALVVYAFGSTLNPLLLGLVSGLGSTIGEMFSYFLGWGGRKVIESRYGSRLDAVEKLIDRYGALTVFLAALLPIPDDLLLIPLGMMKYDIKKTFIAMLLGKTLMCTLLAFAGAFSFSYLRDVFASVGVVGGVASLIILVIIIIAMVKIDWVKILDDKIVTRTHS